VTKATKPKFNGYKFINFIRTLDPAICLVLTQAASAFTVYDVKKVIFLGTETSFVLKLNISTDNGTS
jgi:hypothetical protein